MPIAMHAPDGFLEAPVAVAALLVSVVVLGVAVRRTAASLQDRQVPLVGASAAFVFAAQMLNFPVAAGTTGHLMGAALAAVLLGPWTGTLVVAVVVIVQALVFADGGITALGINVLNMAIVPAFGGWAVFVLCRRFLPANGTGVVAATGLAAGASVVLSSMAFSLEWLFGASAPVPFDTVFAAMVGVHLLIGVGEGIISALVVAAVLAARPDLVFGAQDLTSGQQAERPRVPTRTFVVSAALVALVLATVVSQVAATDPDGLESVADQEGFAEQAEDHPLLGSPFADYATEGIDDEGLSLALAGLTGLVLVTVVGTGIVAGSRRTRASATTAA